MNCKLYIDDALLECIYDPFVQSELSKDLKLNYSDSQYYKCYLYSSQAKNHKIIVIGAKLEIQSHSMICFVNLMIYLVKGYPDQPPLLFIDKPSNMTLTPQCSFYINESNYQINYDMFFNWRKYYDSLRDLLIEVKRQFSNNYPLIQMSDDIKMKKTRSIVKQLRLIELEFNNKNKEMKTNINKEKDCFEEDKAINRVMTFQEYYSRINTETNGSVIHKEKPIRKRRSFDFRINDKTDDNINNDKEIKRALIKSIIGKTEDKVIEKIRLYAKTMQQIKTFMSYLNDKINKLDIVLNQDNTILLKIDNYNTQVKNITFTHPKISSENIDDIIEINNKPLLTSISKANSIEDYLSFIKFAFKRSIITLDQSIIEYRNSSLTLFKIKYKPRLSSYSKPNTKENGNCYELAIDNVIKT